MDKYFVNKDHIMFWDYGEKKCFRNHLKHEEEPSVFKNYFEHDEEKSVFENYFEHEE